MNSLLNINPATEKEKIVSFIKSVLKKQNFKNVVIGMSGGIDSTTSFYLLKATIPPENIFVAHLYYFQSQMDLLLSILNKATIPPENIYNMSIKDSVGGLAKTLFSASEEKRIRLGNIMARVRMTILYDLAKKHNGLVCGTENKSELLLGYFTRFGDEASDFEPIQHLYKTQVYALAKYLDVPKNILKMSPTAGLWEGQTDEEDFGFSYQEADSVLRLYFEEKNSPSEIISKGFPKAQKIIDRANKNSFKHHLPYVVK